MWRRPLVVTGGVVFVLLAVVVAGLALLLSNTNWNFLRGQVGRAASAMSGRTVIIHGNLTAHLLSLTPSATADDLEVDSSNGIPGELARVRRFAMQARLLPLLRGQVQLPLIDLEQPDVNAMREADGRANWRTPAGGRALARLPPIEHFEIHDGRLHMVDQTRRLVLDATVQSSETLNGAGKGAFRLVGRGLLNHAQFSLDLNGGSLLHIKASQPYAFTADLRAGATHVQAKGVLPHPFDFGQVRCQLTVSGNDLATLYPLTGVAFPNTPPYSLSGQLVRDGLRYRFDPIQGRAGHSDLAGAIAVDHISGRPFVRAELRSRSLALADLGATVGAPIAGPRSSSPQRALAAKSAGEDRLLPDATLDFDRIRSTDAVLRYRADSVIAGPNLPLRQVRLNLRLDHGVLLADPLELQFPKGELAGRARLDASRDTPEDAVDFKVSNLRLADFFAGARPSPVDGLAQARIRLTGRGDSVRKAAASANGTLALVVPHGEVRRTLGELLGINVTKALGLMLAEDQSEMDVRCAVAQFTAKDGVLSVDQAVFDSDTVRTDGKGQVDLKDETLHLTLTGHPKRFRLVRLQSPITIAGQLRSPKVGVKAGAAPAQAGAAVALGAALTPLGAILPFVDPGLAHDADCSAVEADARSAAQAPSARKAAAEVRRGLN